MTDEDDLERLKEAVDGLQAAAGPAFAIPPWDPCDRLPGDHTYCLPAGRYLTTEDRIIDRLVAPWRTVDSRRDEIWSIYKQRSAVLEDLLPRPYTDWISGSFTSDKTAPGDIDVVTVIPHDTWEATSDPARARVQADFQGRKTDDYDWFTFTEIPQGSVNLEEVVVELDDEDEALDRLIGRAFWDSLWSSHKQGGERGFLMLRRNYDD